MSEALNLRRRLAPLSRIITAAIERYEELGAVRGNLRLAGLSEAERVALSGLLGEPVKTRPGETLVLPLKRLDAVFQERTLGEGLLDVAATVMDRPIQTRAEQADARQQRWESLLLGVLPPTGGRAAAWRERLLAGDSSAIALLKREFQQEERPLAERAVVDSVGESHGAGMAHGALTRALQVVSAAVDNLPLDRHATQRLPVFASLHTGDPHGFDENQFAGRLLLRALTDLLGGECGIVAPPADAVERGLLLTAAGLLPDGVSSTIACYGLGPAIREDGTADPQVDGARSDHAVLVASLRQVGRWQSVNCGPVLYAVENPAVFEELVDALQATGVMLPLVCTSGFLSVAAHRVLDLAMAAGTTICYGGDFDGNGVTIAAKLAGHYGHRVRFWHMAREDYVRAADHPLAQKIAEGDTEKLARIAEPRLIELAAGIRAAGRVAYQEALLSELKGDLLEGPERN